jgi:hypothetical protein
MTCYDHLTDPVVRLALRIARRADELARGSCLGHQPWLRAEEEILGIRLPEPPLPASDPAMPATEPAEASAAW